MTENSNNNSLGENSGLGDFLAAELQGVIKQRAMRSELRLADLERELRTRIGFLYRLSSELKECSEQLKIEMPVADESEDANAPKRCEQSESRYDQGHGYYRFGGGGQGGLPPGLWGW